MAERDESALVTFNHKIELRQAPTTNRSAVVDTLERVKATGATAVIDAAPMRRRASLRDR